MGGSVATCTDTGNLKLTAGDAGGLIVQSLVVQKLRSTGKKNRPGVEALGCPPPLPSVCERGKTLTISLLCCLHDATKGKMRRCQVGGKEIRSRNSRARAREWRQSPPSCPEQSKQRLLIPSELNLWERELNKERQWGKKGGNRETTGSERAGEDDWWHLKLLTAGSLLPELILCSQPMSRLRRSTQCWAPLRRSRLGSFTTGTLLSTAQRGTRVSKKFSSGFMAPLFQRRGDWSTAYWLDMTLVPHWTTIRGNGNKLGLFALFAAYKLIWVFLKLP